MIINQANLLTIYTGFRTVFNQAFEQAPSQYERVAMTVQSSTKQETYGWLGQSTRFREWLGERVIQNLQAHDFTIRNRSFENTIGVNREDIEDDQFGVYAPLFSQLGMDAKCHRDELVFELLKAGFDTTCYDGTPFFGSAHPYVDRAGKAKTQSNTGGGSGTAWYLIDASKMVKPIIVQMRKDYNFVSLDRETDENTFFRKQYVYGTDARLNVGVGLWQLAYASKQTLDDTNFWAAIQAMQSVKGDSGKPLNIRPTLLVVPPSLEQKARELLERERNAAGESNILRNRTDLLVTQWLDI